MAPKTYFAKQNWALEINCYENVVLGSNFTGFCALPSTRQNLSPYNVGTELQSVQNRFVKTSCTIVLKLFVHHCALVSEFVSARVGAVELFFSVGKGALLALWLLTVACWELHSHSSAQKCVG